LPKYRPDEITYELFGIDPAEFYATKFACGRGIDDALANPIFRYEIVYEKIRRLIADLRMLVPDGGRVLDIGCGAGPYAPTLLANVPDIRLFGVDMSEACLEQAAANGYSDCRLFNLYEPLPFDDEYFDAVISMDVFGHIEFRQKDFLIGETARITRRGGGGHHGVETAFIDYFDCDPRDENDPVRKYVYVDGHVGAEPTADVCARFAKYFDVTHHITYLYPFLDLAAFSGLFGEEFKSLVARHHHPEAVQLASLILGRLNTCFLERFSTAFGDEFTPQDGRPDPGDSPNAKVRELFRPGGFSSLTLRRPVEKRAGFIAAGTRYNLERELARSGEQESALPMAVAPVLPPIVNETFISMIGSALRRRSPNVYRVLAPFYRALRRRR